MTDCLCHRGEGKLLEVLHHSHQGQTRTYEAARGHYWWPGLREAVVKLTSMCEVCFKSLATMTDEEELLDLHNHTGPMESDMVDLFELGGKMFLCMVDVWSGYSWVYGFKKTLSTWMVTNVLNTVFWAFVFPRQIHLDGGGQFRTEFAEYCDTNEVVHKLGSPYHPLSNGCAECNLGLLKLLMNKTTDSGQVLEENMATSGLCRGKGEVCHSYLAGNCGFPSCPASQTGRTWRQPEFRGPSIWRRRRLQENIKCLWICLWPVD